MTLQIWSLGKSGWSDGWWLDADGNRISYDPQVTQIDGKNYVPLTTDSRTPGSGTPDSYLNSPVYGDVLTKYPNAFKQGPDGQWYLSTDAQSYMSDVSGVRAEAKGNTPWKAFSQTIGPAMGLAGALGAMGVATVGGTPYQSLWSSLADHAASAGGSFSDISSAFGGAGTPGVGAGDLPASYDRMLAEGGSTMNDASPAAAGTIDGISPYISGAAGATGAAAAAGAGAGGAAAGGVFGTGLTGSQLLGVGGGALALGGLASSGGKLGGSTSQTSSTNIPPMTQEERDLISLNAELTKRQLASIDQLAPFQKQMLEMALQQMQDQAAQDKVINGAVTPEEQAALARQQYESALKSGQAQDEIQQIQLDTLRRGGAATPEQMALIHNAANAGIDSANADIDANTQRGIGLIADELSNARGLRLSDSPMSSEAALLAREGTIQKGGVEKSLRANEANATLSYPLAVQGLQSQIGTSQQQIAQAANDFQETLRQRAFQNRMALTGNATSTGLGLSSVGGGNGALSALTQRNLAGASTTTDVSRGLGLSDYGSLAGGIGSLMYGYGRLFPNG